MDPEVLKSLDSKMNESTKALLCSKDKIDKMKASIVLVVESLLEKNISSEELIDACKLLSLGDYSDVVEERNILNLCGYPLCPNVIKLTPQKYHISMKEKKVYDMTERKAYCSDQCYRASKVVKHQLSEEPVWFQKEPVIVKLIVDDTNSGSCGEEVVFTKCIEEKHIQDPEKESEHAIDLRGLVEDETIDRCVTQFEELTTKDINKEDDEPVQKTDEPSPESLKIADVGKEAETLPENVEDDLKRFPEHENENVPMHATMPAVKIPKSKSTILLSEALPKTVKTSKSSVSYLYIGSILHQWMSGDVLKRHKSKHASGEKADCTSKTPKHEHAHRKDVPHLAVDTRGTKSQDVTPKKSVKFSDSIRVDERVCHYDGYGSDPVIPLVDSLSQNQRRLQIVMEKLRLAYNHVLPLVGLRYGDIHVEIKSLLLNFSFSASNISYNSTVWRMIAVVLLRMLRCCSDQILEELLHKSSLRQYGPLLEIDKIISCLKKFTT